IGKLTLDLPETQLLPVHRGAVAPAVADVSAAVRDSLDHPVDYPPLRRALTPDDHVAVVVDESLPDLASILSPLLEHLLSAHVTPDAVTLVCAERHPNRTWLDRLPPQFLHV